MHPLATKIAALQRRLVRRRRAAALCLTAATLLAAALALGLVDYTLRFSDRGLRLLFTASLAGVAAWAVYRWWYLPNRVPDRPDRHHMPALAVARRVEAQFPQLGDSLASAVEFLQQAEDDATAGSAQLRRIVVAEAATAIDELPLEVVIDRRPLRRAAGWAAAALGVLALFAVLDAQAVVTAAARLAAPFGGAEWPRSNYLRFRNAPTRLAAGQTFEAELVDVSDRPPDEVWIAYRLQQDGRRQTVVETMTRVGDTLVAHRENVRNSFAFRAFGGDDQTMRWIDVEVVEPPRIESLQATIHPPAYTGLPPVAAERQLHVLAGSRIEVNGMASEPLAAARILLDGGQTIAARILADSPDGARRRFLIDSDQWAATTSGSYRLELENVSGVAGVVGTWPLRVEPDAPPNLAWKRPKEDLYVLATALVPLAVDVTDDLAVHTIDLIFERIGREGSGRFRIAEFKLESAAGPPRPAGQIPTAREEGDKRTAEYAWPLTPLGLVPGERITLYIEAGDFRPNVGRTPVPRHVTVISIEELDSRLAEQQAQIVRRLKNALTAQRATREEVRRLEIQHRDARALADGDRNSLHSAEINQRHVDRILVDANEGVPAIAASLLEDLAMNRVDSPDVERAMRELAATLAELGAGPLDVATRELTTARKTVEVANMDAAALARSLASTVAAQDEVLAIVERLTVRLSEWTDFRRFIRQLTELRDDQIAHERSIRGEIGFGGMPLELGELTRDQRARLNQAAAAEESIASRSEQIVSGIERLAGELDHVDAAASNRLFEAVALARQLAIAANMHDAVRELAANQVGRALTREAKTIDDLERVLDVLRDDRPEGAELLASLQVAEQELATLRQQLTDLREQVAGAANDSARIQSQLEQRQQVLRREIEQLARRLENIGAGDAGESAQTAADRLDGLPVESRLEQAGNGLEEAAQRLAESRARAELDVALELMHRFRADLGDMVARQKSVVDATLEIDELRQARPGRDASAANIEQLEQLADEERQLADLAVAHSEMLAGLGAVRVSLEDAARKLAAAAELLAGLNSNTAAQEAERLALTRLEALLDAFAETVEEAAPTNGGNVGGNNAGGARPQRRPALELLEIKLLRLLQVELNQRTERHERRQAAGDDELAEIEREAWDLAVEQARLAELVKQMLLRNNSRQRSDD